MENKIYISWEKFEKDIKTLCTMLQKDATKFNKLAVIANGALIPAYYVKRNFMIAEIDVMSLVSYRFEKKLPKPQVIPHSKKKDTRKNWLIIDDLVDTGDSFNIVKEYFPHSRTACLYRKPHSPEVDYFVEELDGWIVFPWET